jgi:uncharacterized protein (DUF2252 family)
MKANVIERILTFNQGRDPELLRLKYKAMGSDIFSFFRGTCHLFYEDFPADSLLNEAPCVWVCGDLHLENFGSYKGDNRLAYFDINDFDESALAPCTWDVTRLLTSILVAYRTLNVNESQALTLCNYFIDAYTNTLSKGQIRSVERDTAKGLVKDLLDNLKKRNRQDFLDKRTEEKKGKRHLIIDNKRTRKATDAQQQKITTLISNWAATQPQSKFFQVLDVQQRIAGTGSLGVERYVVLVEGKGSPNHNYLLDLKQARPSALQSYLKQPQSRWENEAARVVNIQQWVQATPPALLDSILDENIAYVLRELQPFQDKVNLQDGEGKLGRLEKLMETMGEVTAWAHLRSCGRLGSAIADQLIQYGKQSHWCSISLDYARDYSAQVKEDYTAFCSAMNHE